MKRSVVLASCICVASALGALAASPVRSDNIDLPMRKPGLWDLRMKMTGGGIPTMSMQQCTDAATDKDLRSVYSPMSKEVCSKHDVQRTATGYMIDRVCKRGDDTITSHIAITGDFNSAYQAHLLSRTQDESPDDPPSSDLTMQAKYLGPCKDDQKPGDIILMGGMRINIREILKLREQQSTDSAATR
jgi:hypothetical protein